MRCCCAPGSEVVPRSDDDRFLFFPAPPVDPGVEGIGSSSRHGYGCDYGQAVVMVTVVTVE